MPATRYLPIDMGAAILISGHPYGRVSETPVAVAPDTSLSDTDVMDIIAYTWHADDDNVEHGDDHRTWTACQMAVADHILSGSIVIESADYNTWQPLMTAPRDGIVRVWSDPGFTMGGGAGGSVRLNGVFERGYSTIGSTGKNRAIAMKMQQGDTLEARYNHGSLAELTIRYAFCPYVYPIPTV